jgi:hypothetical protein
VVKQLYGYSYEELERAVCDSLVLRQFCRVYLNTVPDDTTLIRWANLVQSRTLEQFNRRITEMAVKLKVTQGRKLRTDGTVVETHIHPPRDSQMLADSVRVVVRTLERAKKVLIQSGELAQQTFVDLNKEAKRVSHQISEAMRKRSDEAKQAGKEGYRRLIEITQTTLQHAQEALPLLEEQASAQAQKLAATLNAFMPRAEQVIDQATRRIFKDEKVPATELDFGHLNLNKKQGMLRQSLGQEVAYADPAGRIYHNPWILCELVLAADLEACEDLVDRGNPFSRRTNGDRGIARDGVEHGKAFRELPSCFESCEVVELGSEPDSVGTVDPDLCDPRSGDLGPRRHDRTATGSPDQSQRNLSGSGSFEPWPLCQGEWFALVEPDAAHPDSLGGSHLGSAIPDCIGTFRTVLPEQSAQAQEAHRVGLAGGSSSSPLAAPTAAGGHRG